MANSSTGVRGAGARRSHKRLGDILPGTEVRFWPLVEKGAPDECWSWRGALVRDRRAWPIFRPTPGVQVRAHRAAYFFVNGAFDDRELICPCTNRACVNPMHLKVSTRAAKAAEARLARRKLNAEQVRAIFLDPRSAAEVAREYGVTPRNLTCIRRRQTWGEVTADLPAVARDARGRALTPPLHCGKSAAREVSDDGTSAR
jgi:hypothetical protein